MAKYCPIMSHQNKWQDDVECWGKECAWADKDGICLIAKELKQRTDPISLLVQGYPVDNGQANYSDIDRPYRPLKIKFEGENWKKND